MDHGLPELGLFVGMLDDGGLVDNVHQVARLRNTPEYPVGPEPQLQLPFADLAQ